MNISYIAGIDPMYDKHNPYVVQATETYGILKNSLEKMEFYLFRQYLQPRSLRMRYRRVYVKTHTSR